MRIRDWQDVLEDVVESDAKPDDWRAVAGTRARGVGEDMYLGHPSAGVFHIKTYAKNPYEVKGVGAKVARKLDDEIGSFLPEDHGRNFAVQTPPSDEDDAKEKAQKLEETIKAHADAPTTPDALFEDVMEAIDSPAFGPLEYDFAKRPDTMDDLSESFEEAEDLLEAEFEDIVREDEVDRGFQ